MLGTDGGLFPWGDRMEGRGEVALHSPVEAWPGFGRFTSVLG